MGTVVRRMSNTTHREPEATNHNKRTIEQVIPAPKKTRPAVRRLMKPRLPRKVTSTARINLNKFWGELEEFYTRGRTETEKPIVMPVWENTDSEEEENRLNEQIEEERRQGGQRMEPMETSQSYPSSPVETSQAYPSSPVVASPPVTPLWNSLSRSTMELMQLINRI